ncbi:uncharacterized protein LOC111716389 [Eurytemora carolleeae]|uniref:uncharacterized protein LOC111716389 n=1 Tax=Eurytemora carolleeae TaxID=1294199 RepID=UPI000C792DE6|nr:uncharacterized protein LOC111716389 [Eurytemora carolleeae]|eukprot:XP_023347602.1 uncharacterized protein LOC111716389 [Eurytemora affinis]
MKFFLFLELINFCHGYILYPFFFERTVGECPVSKPGSHGGEATMFQEQWVHGKTGACGFNKPNSKLAEGFFAAVGAGDWDSGFGCGNCAKLRYKGRSVVVNIVDRCWGCSNGWFDMGGPAWRELTGGEPPGHIYGVESSWIECPESLTGGSNLNIYVKPGSHPWDARFQPVGNIAPVTSMSIDIGSGWREMKKCENFMFCKAAGGTIPAVYKLRVSSLNVNIEIQLSGIPEGQYIDTRQNNGGPDCNPPNQIIINPSTHVSTQSPAVSTQQPTPHTTTTQTVVVGPGNCSEDGLFPDPGSCKGFIKCAQGNS